MRIKSKHAALIALVEIWATVATAQIAGTVTSQDGTPIEHAEVRVVDGVDRAFTGPAGGFRLPDAEPPVVLSIGHPKFKAVTVAVDGSRESIAIVLEAKQKIFEEIAVSATRGERNFAPVSVAAHVVRPEESAAPQTLAEIVAEVPAVAENGQGGIFQTYSVRGVSRQRVLTLIEGMRVVSERRAGVSASFVDPGLMQAVDVLKGPSSTYYGSGALGGVVQLFARRFSTLTVEGGVESQGNARRMLLGWGAQGWSFGLAHRQADEAETAAGTELNSAFTQTSATLGRRWQKGRLEYSVTGVASAGRDIGKANTEFPERATVYPEEEHLLLRFSLARPDQWSLDAWVHPNELETLVTEEGEETRVDNRAFDLGLNFQARRSRSDRLVLRYGVDYFGRRSVTADEVQRFSDGSLFQQRTLDGGTEDELGIYGALEWSWKRAVILAGGRSAFERQSNAGAGTRSDTALTAFTGLVMPLASGFELVANLGTGLRFPSLSERFFSGTTGRGLVVGNPELEPESALNADLGLRWYGDKVFLAGYVFRNDIDDYIERVEIAPGELTFVNLVSGEIEGLELEGAYQVRDQVSLTFGGHAITGRSPEGAALADIPADAVFLGAHGAWGRWSWRSRWERRRAKDDPGSGEKTIGAADLLSATLRFELQDGLTLGASARNLLDEEYFGSADRRVSPAPGRSIGLSLAWRRAAGS